MARKKKSDKQSQEEGTQLDPKEKSLQLAIGSLEQSLGKGIILTGPNQIDGVEWFSSGCMSLNKALSGNYKEGYPRGRFIEILGAESSGKTTLALHAIAEIQKLGERAAFIDAEHALDPLYATSIGVDMDKLLVSQPNSGEQALQVVHHLTSSGAVSLIVVDSVAALVPQAELEGEIGDSHMGRQARLMSQAMRILSGAADRTNTSVIFINQIRMKIGVMFGNPETTTGGNALKFYASQRLDVRRTGGVAEGAGDDKEFIANTTRVKVIKNKVSPPFREARIEIKYGHGIDKEKDLVSIAVSKKIIEKAGSWYSMGETKLGQGEGNVLRFLAEHPEVVETIQKGLIGG